MPIRTCLIASVSMYASTLWKSINILAVKIRQTLFSALLALLLLMTQQMGLAHSVSHLSRSHATSQEKQLPIGQVCDQCLAFAQIGSALTGHAFSAAADAPLALVLDVNFTQIIDPVTVCVFHSRAPPSVM
jgi:hypothetical protein